jgi:acyl-[acyl carrier protein]--UDP-N-acetylglucosamine O-acyltransferase
VIFGGLSAVHQFTRIGRLAFVSGGTMVAMDIAPYCTVAGNRAELAGLNTTFRANTVQLRAEVDREKTTLLGVPISDVYSAIQAQFGSLMATPMRVIMPMFLDFISPAIPLRKG